MKTAKNVITSVFSFLIEATPELDKATRSLSVLIGEPNFPEEDNYQ